MVVSREIIFYLPDFGCGGVEKVFFLLAKHFDLAGVPVTFVVGNLSGELSGAVPPNVPVVDLQVISRRKQIFKLAKYLQEKKCKDYVVVTGGEVTNIVVMMSGILAKSLDKIVPSIRSTISVPMAQKPIFVRKLVQIFHYFSLKRVHKVICNSAFAAREVKQHFDCPEKKITVIYNPVDLESIKSLALEEHVLPPTFDGDLVTICNVGSLTPLKSQITLLQATKEIIKHRNVNVVLVGDGPEHAALQEFVSSHAMENNVFFAGFQDNPYPYIRMADIYVNTSKTEGCPNAIQEALCLGVPVIATDSPGGTAEVLADGRRGVLVPPESPICLATAILDLLAGTVIRDESVAFVERRYKADVIAKEYLAALFDTTEHPA